MHDFQSSTSVIGSSSESGAARSNPNTSRLVILAACDIMVMLNTSFVAG